METLLNSVYRFIGADTNETTTENRDKAYATSLSCCLDFFTRIVRNAPINDLTDAFNKAWQEDPEVALKLLFNLRDARNGKGEKLLSIVLLVLIKLNTTEELYATILRQWITYGCWKDLLKVMEMSYHLTKTNAVEIQLFADALQKDSLALSENENAAISLCAKWAPSENTHYDRKPLCFATAIAKQLQMTPKQYRQLLTKLRSHLHVLEQLMATQKYDQIDFSKLPSIALMKMKRAFDRDCNAKNAETEGRKQLHLNYKTFLQMLSENKTKVNVKGIQPHELVNTYLAHHAAQIDPLVEEQWKTLKLNVMKSGTFREVTAVVDVSGSMQGQPMEVAIALGILVAECTEGAYHGKVITFHETPSWHQLVGENLKQQVDCMKAAPWGGSTNLRAVFDLILQNAIAANLAASEMVKTLFIFTDMQFNQCDRGNWQSTFEYARQAFSAAGYTMPKIICWNLRTSNSKTMPVTKDEEGYAMLSGFSSELLKCILDAKEFSPMAIMMHVLEPYDLPLTLSTALYAIKDLVLPTTMTVFETAVEKSKIVKSYKKIV